MSDVQRDIVPACKLQGSWPCSSETNKYDMIKAPCVQHGAFGVNGHSVFSESFTFTFSTVILSGKA